MNPTKLIPLASVLLFVVSANFSTAQILVQDRGVERSLDQQITLNLNDVAFEVVWQKLKYRYHVNLEVTPSALDAGLSDQDIVSFNSTGVSLRNALSKFLDKYDCSFVTYGNAVRIMPIEECQKTIQIKSYDCRKLIKSFSPKTVETVYYNGERTDMSVESLDSILNSKRSDKQETRTDAGNGRVASSHYLVHRRELTAGQNLADVIKQLTPADSWAEGGGKGTISVVNGWLMIRQNGIIHQDIPRLLDLLEKDLSSGHVISQK